MRDCQNCKHLIMYDYKNKSYSCEKWQCEFEPKEQEPKTGHWIETHDDWGNGIITDRKYKCSVCHGKHIDPEMGEWHEVFDYKYPFCPNCGVKMAESEGEK